MDRLPQFDGGMAEHARVPLRAMGEVSRKRLRRRDDSWSWSEHLLCRCGAIQG